MTTTTENLKSLDIAEVAKRVRKEIRDGQKSGRLPKSMKVSVKIDRYSMGCSLSVRVTEIGFQVHNPEWLASYVKHDRGEGDRFTGRAEALLANLDAIVDVYHYDHSDSQQDCFNYNFARSVEFASTVTACEYECAKALAEAAKQQSAAPRLTVVRLDDAGNITHRAHVH